MTTTIALVDVVERTVGRLASVASKWAAMPEDVREHYADELWMTLDDASWVASEARSSGDLNALLRLAKVNALLLGVAGMFEARTGIALRSFMLDHVTADPFAPLAVTDRSIARAA